MSGGVYKEQNEIDTENRLIILHHLTATIEICGRIREELKDPLTDIIIVVNSGTTEDEIMKTLGYLNRKCNKIEVTGLDTVHCVQRMAYGLLKKNSCLPKDDDHKMF